MKRMSLVALATVMTFGALKADDVAAAQTPAAEVAATQTQTAPADKVVSAAAKPGFVANAWGSVKGGVSTVYNTTKAGVYVPFTKNNANWTNFGKTAAVVLATYVGYKAVKAVCGNDSKCCVSNRK